MNHEHTVLSPRSKSNTRTPRRPVPLFVVGRDHEAYDPRYLLIGTLAELRQRYPAFDSDADPPPGLWFANPRFSIGILINPDSTTARALYVACTDETKAAPEAVYAWLADDASQRRHLHAASVLIARRQADISDQQLRQLLLELAMAEMAA
jgi:hypothetical protein